MKVIMSSRFKGLGKKRRLHRQFRNDVGFVVSTVKTPLGTNVVVAEKSRVLKRISKKDSVLHKHLDWLKQLEKNKRELEEEKNAAEEKRLNRLRLLKRDAAGARKEVAPATKGGAAFNASTKPIPAWCQTTEEASKKTDELVDDTEQVLDFVKELDFDQYNEDLELQTLMNQVKHRIKELEKERRKDVTRLQACVDVST